MENENKLKNKNVKTYTDEMVKAIESGEGSMIKKIIHEEEEHEAEKKNLSPGSKKNRVFMFVGILLVILALLLLIFLAFFQEKINVVPVEEQFTSLIFNDQTDFQAIDGLSKEKIAETSFNKTNTTKVKIGGIEGLYLTENTKVVGFKRFNELIKSNLDLSKTDLFGDNFLLGVFKSGLDSVSPNKGEPFFLIKIKSFTDVFPVLHKWEGKMLHDLSLFFGMNISAENNYLFTKNFDDGIVENKNARILKDNGGNTVLMYVFANDNSIIITKSNLAVREVILRLFSTKIKK